MRNRDAVRTMDLQGGGIYLPICLCLDTSSSMLRKTGGADRVTGEHIGPTRLDLLNEGVRKFVTELFDDETVNCTVEIAVVTFDDTARVLTDFSPVERCEFDRQSRVIGSSMLQIPELQVDRKSRGTAMCEGIKLALSRMQKCKEDYQRYSVDYYQPWLVLITDGMNTDSQEDFEQVKALVHELVRTDKLWVYPFAVGTRAGAEALEGISPAQPVLQLDFDALPKVFKAMSRSAARVSSSGLNARPPVIEPYTVISWADGLL